MEVSMAGETVLIIDDSAELRSVLETVLPFGGYTVLCAATGEAGLALASEQRPDLVMVDLELPDTNGLRVLEELNAWGLTVPTIMMTGYGSEGVAARALRLGVRDYLIKPFTTDEVLASVERALSESRLEQEKERLITLVSGYARHLKLLGAIGRSVTSGLDQREVLQRITGAGLYITRAQTAFLLLQEDGSEEMRIVCAEGLTRPGSSTTAVQRGDKRLLPVLENGEAVRLVSAGAPTIQLQTGASVEAVLQVPLEGSSRRLGLLSVDRQETQMPFSEYDEQVLKILADYAVVALMLPCPEPGSSGREMDGVSMDGHLQRLGNEE
jgi:two-component system NtrC family sensor kinase